MPTYDYKCESCGKSFEISQKITAEPLTECPECHKACLKRGIGGGSATLRFEGSGFYITDYGPNKKDPPPSCGSSCKCC